MLEEINDYIGNKVVDVADYLFDHATNPDNKLHVVMYDVQKKLTDFVKKINPNLFTERIEDYCTK
jgi:hypothetical protein